MVTQDEGHVELEISDDPYDVQTVDVKSAPCIVTLSKVRILLLIEAVCFTCFINSFAILTNPFTGMKVFL